MARFRVLSYDYDRNECEAKVLDWPSADMRLRVGEVVTFDPFVTCAYPLTPEAYKAGKGRELVGKVYETDNCDVQFSQACALPVEGSLREVTS